MSVLSEDLRYAADELERMAAELGALKAAAQAVVARWDTPLWKDVPATAEYINALRKVLETP